VRFTEEDAHIKRSLVVLLVTALSVNALAPAAEAQGFIGEFCFRFVSYNEGLKLATTATGSQFELHGQWAASGYSSYEMAMTGSAFVRSNGTVEFAVQGPNSTDSFSGQPVVALRANLNTATLAGPFTIKGIGNGSAFSNSGTLAITSCVASDRLMADGALPSVGGRKGQ
jgi:hypothetical protein